MDTTPRTSEPVDADEERRLDIALGSELRGLRNKRRMNQDQLAAASKIGKRTLVRIETGDKPVTMAQLYRLAKALGVRPSVIIDAAESEIIIGE